MKNQSIILILFCFLIACKSNRYIFKKERFNEFEKLTLKKAIKIEKSLGSKDNTPDNHLRIGESIYPNIEGFNLDTPKVFERNVKPCFKLRSEYFYTPVDSSIKVILYQWDYQSGVNKRNSQFTKKGNAKKVEAFRKKFNKLKKKLKKELGNPAIVEIDSNKDVGNFRDGIKWLSNNGLNAYLFMFGNNQNSYRQIRLAIYH